MSINRVNLDPHADAIDGITDPWRDCYSSRESARVFREERVVLSHPVPIRHRKRATVRGFVMHPLVSLGLIAVFLSALAAMVWAVFS